MSFTSDVFGLPTELLCQLVVSIIESLVDSSESDKGQSNKFTAAAPPQITLSAYLARLAKYLPLQNDSIVLLLLYIRRIALNASPATVCHCSTAHYLHLQIASHAQAQQMDNTPAGFRLQCRGVQGQPSSSLSVALRFVNSL